jgi:DNA repair exonuclease SbcCD ATPase subunit
MRTPLNLAVILQAKAGDKCPACKKKVLIHRHKKVSGKQKSTVNHNKKTLVKSFKKLRAVSQPRITRLQRRLENLRTVDAQL